MLMPVTGYVTRLGSPTDFDVNGMHVLVNDRTVLVKGPSLEQESQPESTLVSSTNIKFHLFEAVRVDGAVDDKTHVVRASRIKVEQPGYHMISGTAIIDAILPLPAGASPSTDCMIRADGYRILLTGKTANHFKKPLSSTSDIHVNIWINYHGALQPDGTVVADTAYFEKNTTSRSLDSRREQWEYDPNAIPDDTHQSGVSRLFRGNDPRQYPPHKDEPMQARIDAIGAKLVPKYQFEFPYTEETRIDFRFYLVDAPKWRDAMPLPNGIVLVPYQLVGWMQNDSQLAAILADKVACLLEKQPMFLPATDADLAMDAAELGARVVPFVGPAEDIAGLTFGVNSLRQTHLRRQQRDRVSLALMHDAGYDVMQAPIAWWLLSSKKQKDVAEIPQPARAKYFYEVLGETWASELATTESAPATAAPQ
jgi:hypothetical protein